MTQTYIIGKPGGPAGPFHSIVRGDGRVMAMMILTEEAAVQIVNALRIAENSLDVHDLPRGEGYWWFYGKVKGHVTPIEAIIYVPYDGSGPSGGPGVQWGNTLCDLADFAGKWMYIPHPQWPED